MHPDIDLPHCESCTYYPHENKWMCGRKKFTYYVIRDPQLGLILKLNPWHWAIERTYKVCDKFFSKRDEIK